MSEAQTTIRIRPRAPGDDDAAIAELLTAAFRGAEEARLVDRLRGDGDCVCELVALDEGGAIVGHVLFSRLVVAAASQTLKAAALAPLAVKPDVQRRRIGDALTRAGLKACANAGCELAVVLGHPAYYPRFGFSALLAKLLDAPYAGSPSFMALELKPGVLDGLKWTVTYPRAFTSA